MKTQLRYFLIVTLGLAALSTAAQAPGIISHQGKVTVNGTNYTGPGQFRFALVNGDGSATYWSNDGATPPSAAVSLTIARGVFSVNLGDTTVANMTQTIPASVFTDNSAVYLRVWFNEGTLGWQLLTPDLRLTSVGYALSAASAVENDPVFGSSPAASITSDDLNAWNDKVPWGRSISTTSPLTGGGDLGGDLTLSLPVATSSASGYLSSSDWSTFNGKANGGANGNITSLSGLTTPLSVAQGGSGAATASAGLNNLLPNQTGNSGKVLGTDGANASWVSAGGSSGTSWQVVSGVSQQAQANAWYLAANDAQVTITLPAAPNIGDSVRISGSGAGGWKVAQNSGQWVMLPERRGVKWIARDSDRAWSSVASSADGTKLVAAARSGYLYTSTDSGVTWTERAADTTRNWCAVASSADGTKLVAAETSGQLYTSINSGENWVSRAESRNWFSVASSADGTKLVASVYDGQLYTSSDSGEHWMPRATTRNWFTVASSADGTKLVASVDGGLIYTSINSGADWTEHPGTPSCRCAASSADGTKLVAGGYEGLLYTSTDSGENWTAREAAGQRWWISVASSADGTKLAAAADTGQLYTSTDSGATWTARDVNRPWSAVASSADGMKLLAAVGSDADGQLYTSTAGSTLGAGGYVTGNQYAALELLYIGGGQFIPLSSTGQITGY